MQLKPCPFCGGDAELEHDTTFTNRFYVKCRECAESTYGFHTLDEAIDAWNSEVNDEQIQP